MEAARLYSRGMVIDRRNMLRWSGAATGALLFGSCGRASADGSGWPGPSVPPTTIPKLPIGMNLAAFSDYADGFPFRNLMWGARPWMTHNADGSGGWSTNQESTVTFDANGYPLEIPVKGVGGRPPQSVFTLLPNTLKPGKYVMLYDGDGSIAGVMETRVVSQSKGRVLLQMSHNRKINEGISIARSNPADPVRNIRIVALADEHVDLAANPFLPEFVKFCSAFHALRFMDWGATNGSVEEEWASRRRPTFYTMIGTSGDPGETGEHAMTPYQRRFSGGAAHEVMIALCNKVGADAWFCIPHRATDEYITEFAKLIHAKLDPKLKVYIEVSNEIWNWQFKQAHWMLHSRRLGDLVEAKGGKAWDDPAKTKGANHPERIGMLFGHALQTFHTAWPARDRGRVIRVCATQTGWLDVALRTIDTCVANGGCDAVAQTAYFGPGGPEYDRWQARGAALTGEEVINDMRSVVHQQTLGGAALDAARHAQKLGLKYIVYEGGQHIQPKGQADLPYNPALGAAQSLPGMEDLYLDILRTEVHLGCSLFCAFNSVGGYGSRFGSWGHKVSYDQPDSESPKFRALVAANVPRT